MSKRKLIFVHVPKTGGSTLHGIINRNYKKSSIFNVKNNDGAQKLDLLSEKERQKIRVFAGHCAFGHHVRFSDPENFSYVTILRHPVSRLISNYYFILWLKERHYAYKILTDNKMTLKEYVSSGLVRNTENLMVRMLSDNLEVPHGGCTREMLELAKENLDRYFSVVGVNVLYDESILFMKEKYGWKYPFYAKANVSSHGVKPKDLDNETLETIEKFNALDIELYTYAKDNMEKRIASAGELFQKKLARYRRQNNWFVIIAKIKRVFWK